MKFGTLLATTPSYNEEDANKSKYEIYNSYFEKAKRLCVNATKCKIRTTIDYFVDNGLPQEFMDNCWNAHLIGGGKNGQNIMWNWSKNFKYPDSTIANFLQFVKEQEESKAI